MGTEKKTLSCYFVVLLFCCFAVNIFLPGVRAFTAGENVLSMTGAASASLSLSDIDIAFPQLSPSFAAESVTFTAGELYWQTPFQRISYDRPGAMSFCASVSRMQTLSSDVWDELGSSGGSFREEQTFLNLSAARKYGKFSPAVSYTFMRQSIYNKSGTASSAGAGCAYYPAGIKIKSKSRTYMPFMVAFWGQNIAATELNTGSVAEKIPLNAHLFLNSNLLRGDFSLYLRESVMDVSGEKQKKQFFGAKIRLSEEIFLRAGKSGYETSYGAGINLGRFAIDLAAAAGDAGSRFIASVSFDFSYTGDISENIIKSKNEEIASLARKLKDIENNSAGMGEEERKWIAKMSAMARDKMSRRDFSGAAKIIVEMAGRFAGGVDAAPEERLTKDEARSLALKARQLMENGNYEEASKAIKRSMRALSGDPEAEETGYLIDAHIKIAEGKYELARAILAEGIVIKPDSVEIVKLMKRIDKYLSLTEEK